MSGNEEAPIFKELEEDLANTEKMLDEAEVKIQELENDILDLEIERDNLLDAVQDIAYRIRNWR